MGRRDPRKPMVQQLDFNDPNQRRRLLGFAYRRDGRTPSTLRPISSPESRARPDQNILFIKTPSPFEGRRQIVENECGVVMSHVQTAAPTSGKRLSRTKDDDSRLPLDHTFELRCSRHGIRDRPIFANVLMQKIESPIVFVRIDDKFIVD